MSATVPSGSRVASSSVSRPSMEGEYTIGNMTPSPRRHSLALDALAAIASASLACGCSRPSPHVGVPAAPRSFEAQLADVHDGAASRIVVEAPLADAEWEALRGLAGLRELVLRGGVADDARATILASLPDVERLVLRDSPLSDEGFRKLASLRTLRNLNVPQSACTADGVRALETLPALAFLRLGGPHLGGSEVCRAVASLPAVESLHLVDVRIGDEGLEILAEVPRLTTLYLDGSGVSDGAWRGYCERRPDVHVHVDQVHHDRDPKRDHDAPHPRKPGPDTAPSPSSGAPP